MVDSADIAEVLRPYFGVSLLKLNADSLGAELQNLPGVDRVAVHIQYPETIVVTFTTGKPAFVLNYGLVQVPVTLRGELLPADWVNSELPVITIVESPDSSVIASAINLFSKYQFDGSVSVQVGNSSIVVTQNGIRIVIDPDRALENWRNWRTVSTIVTEQINEVDLRFSRQAVMRSTEET
jgi:cell division septal protein FtsQ